LMAKLPRRVPGDPPKATETTHKRARTVAALDARFEARPALSRTAGLLAALQHFVYVVKPPLLCETYERTQRGTERKKR